MSHTAQRFHDISCGHRVVGHENKCRHLHGHNYRIHFKCRASVGNQHLDRIGRVIDFSAIKERLCMWVEKNWDHKFLAWDKDPLFKFLADASNEQCNNQEDIDNVALFAGSTVLVSFNPTAENMAQYLVEEIGPKVLIGTGCELVEVTIEETAKCSATYTKGE